MATPGIPNTGLTANPAYSTSGSVPNEYRNPRSDPAVRRRKKSKKPKEQPRSYGDSYREPAPTQPRSYGDERREPANPKPTNTQEQTPTNTATPGVTATNKTTGYATTGGKRESALQAYLAKFTRYGIPRGEVEAWLRTLDYETLSNRVLMREKFRQTDMYDKRFGAVMRGREANGKQFMNEGAILDMEQQYKQLLSPYIGDNMYDDEDIQNLLINDVSVEELGSRVSLAVEALNGADPAYKRALRQYYGITKKEMVGYLLDPEKKLRVLQQKAAAVQIGAAGLRTGMDSVSKDFAKALVQKGVSLDSAKQAFETVSETEQDWKKLAALSGEKISEKGLIKDELGLDKNDRIGKKTKRLASQERSRFGGSSGGTGAMGTSTSGSY